MKWLYPVLKHGRNWVRNVFEAEDRFWACLCFAALAHSFFLAGIHVSHEQAATTQSLDITLVTHRNEKAPQNPDFLAQSHQIGSGTLHKKALLATTDITDFNANDNRSVQKQVPQIATSASDDENALDVLSTPLQTEDGVEKTTLSSDSTQTPAPLASGEPTLEERELEIATLQAQLRAKAQAYAKRPRKHQITALSTQADPAALYLDAWREKIETLGNQHYSTLKIDDLYGSLRLMVAINAQGQVVEMQVLKSSGYPKLDEAAMGIVRKAAPFAPFPEHIRKTTDILEIIRTWKFEPGRYSL